MTRPTYELDRWLDEICPFPVFRVTSDTPAALDDEGFFHAKSPVDDLAAHARLQQAGFYLVDTNVTLEWHSGSTASPRIASSEAVAIRRLSLENKSDAEELARRSFRYSRFHQDPLIPNGLADEINARWVRDYFTAKRGEWIDGAFLGERLAGFNAVLRERDTFVIDIIAVDPGLQRQGIGSALMAACMNAVAAAGTRLRIGTQIANVPAVRAYERIGFRLKHARHVFHAHVRLGRCLHPTNDAPWAWEAPQV